MMHLQKSVLSLTLVLVAVSGSILSVPDNYQPPPPPCNNTKIINKVPISELCYWNKVEWIDYVVNQEISDCNLHGNTGNYLVNKNIPTQVVIKDGYGYVLIEREHGVYSTLNRFELKDIDEKKQCPSLRCFPDCASNALAYPNCTTSSYYLTNVRAIHFDETGTTWFLDVGCYKHNDKIVCVQPSKICALQAGTTTPVCIEVPAKYYPGDNAFYFKTWLVNTNEGAGSQYFYLLNSKTGQLVVFSEKTSEFWSVRSVLFKPEPHKSLFHYALPNYHKYEYVVYDGLFTGAIDVDGIYFSSKAGDKLYFLSYKYLNDPASEKLQDLELQIKLLGQYNEKGQTVGLVRDDKVIFSLQVQNRALACFNKKLKLEPEIIQLISVDDNLKHLTSIQLYQDKTDCKKVYFVSNSAIESELYGFDPTKKNCIVSYVDIKEVYRMYPECRDYYTNYYKDLHGLPYSDEIQAPKKIVYDPTKTQKTYELPKISSSVSNYAPPAPYPSNQPPPPYIQNANPIYHQVQYPPQPYPVSTPAPYNPPIQTKPCPYSAAPASGSYPAPPAPCPEPTLVYGQ